MAFDFPATPAQDQEFTPPGGVTYVYKAPRWQAKGTIYVPEAANDGQAYMRQSLGWVLGYSKTALDPLIGTKVAKVGDTMTGPLVMKAAGQSNALIQLRPPTASNSIEWGHSNPAGYGNTLGYLSNSGAGYLAFSAEAGTDINTFRTRGLKGSVFASDNLGGFSWSTIANANADSQSATPLMSLTTAGLLTALSGAFTGGLIAPTVATIDNSTNVATTAFVKAQSYLTSTALATYAPLASPVFTGVVSMPSLNVGTSTSGASAGGGIILAQRTDGFSEGIYFRNEGNTDRGLIAFDNADQLVLRIGDSSITDVTIGAGGFANFGGAVSTPRLNVNVSSDARALLATLTRTSGVAAFAGLGFGTTGAYGFIDYDVNSTNGVRISALGPLRLGSNTNAAYGSEVFTEYLRVASTGVSIPGTTVSTTKTTGALIVSGGVGVAGTITANQLNVYGSTSASLILNKAASGHNSIIYGQTNGVTRWYMTLGNTAAESANGGSDFQITACNDAGTAVLTPIHIARLTGKVSVQGTIASTSTTTGQLTVGGGVGIAGALYVGSTIIGAGSVVASSAYFIGSTSYAIIGPNAGGTGLGVYLRPTAYNDTFGQAVIDANGAMSVFGAITCLSTVKGDNLVPANGAFVGLPTQVILGTDASSVGTIFLRPNGWNTATNETRIGTAGDMVVSGGIATGANGNITAGTFSTTGATGGVNMYYTGPVYHSATGNMDFERFYTPTSPYMNGRITTTAAATAYVTSSDEHLKDINAEMDPAHAIAIIRADPVLDFTWKSTGENGIGWAAQRSHAIDPNLAVPPCYNAEELAARAKGVGVNPGDDGYVPWGIDYGRRTPYLWAALAWAIDELEALTARVAALEET